MRSALLFALLPTIALAQSPTPRPEDVGTVSGHITCADTQRPARLAEVRLVSIHFAPANPKMSGLLDYNGFGNDLPAVQTDMSGAYAIHNVQPGQYYLRVDLAGYLTPLFSFTRDQLIKPTPEIQQRIQHELQVVTIAPHSTLEANTTLQRGASISGAVRFDDGSPAIGIHVQIIRRNAQGEFKEYVQQQHSESDDRGRYSFASLSAGEYIVQASLTLSEQSLQTMPMPNGNMMEMSVMKFIFSLPVYSGSTVRRKDAIPIKLETGQDASGTDITIPVSQLHEVSGSLLAKDGHTINGGRINLLFADDRSQFAGVDVNNDDGTFRFPYVPEGNYILSVKEAKDVGHVEVPNPPGSNPPTHTDHPTLKTYGTLEQPLTVNTDLQAVNLTIPDKPSTTTASN